MMINSLKLFSIIFETHELLITYVHKMAWYALSTIWCDMLCQPINKVKKMVIKES